MKLNTGVYRWLSSQLASCSNPSFHDHDENDHLDHNLQSQTLSPFHQILLPCRPQDFHGKAEILNVAAALGDDELSDDGSLRGEKKRRLSVGQVKTLEKNFEIGKKLESERKTQLAKALWLQPRQISIRFQNRRARWKTEQLEKDYDLLKQQLDVVKADNEALQAQNQKLHAEILALKNREPAESINLNKEMDQGSCSNRSENSVGLWLSYVESGLSPCLLHG